MVAGSQIDHRLVDAFAAIDGVEGIYALQSGENLSVFTVIAEDDEATYDLIYEQERFVIRDLHEVRFDFNVVARRGRPVANIVGSCSPIWQRNESVALCPNVTNT